MATDVKGEQPITTTPLKVAIVDVSDTVKTTAVDRAEEKLTAEAAELKGVKGFFKKIWKFNVAREYYRQREIAIAKKEIVGQDDLYGNKVASHEARAATVERFMSDCDEAVHKEAGETKGTGDDDVQQAVRGLIRDFSAGKLSEDQFQESKVRIFSAVGGKDNPGLMYADNMLEVAKQIKEQIVQGQSIEALMADFQVVVGRAKMGVRTEAQFNAIDRLTSKIMNTRVGSWIGETTVASAMSIAYCLGQNLGVSWMRSKVAQVGSFGATALVSGAIAGAKEGYRVEEERKKHFRDMAKGRSFDTIKDKRRIEMETVRYKTKSAGSLTEGLRQGMGNLEANITADNARSLIGLLAETEARIRLSDQRKIDLLSYSDEKKVEQERFELDRTRAKAKVRLSGIIQTNEMKDVLGGKTWEDFLTGTVGAKMEELRGGEIDPKNKLFNKMKTKRVAGAVVKGVVSGIVIGGITQEISAFFNPNQQGLVETMVTGKNAMATGATRLTPLESLRSYISGDWKRVIGFREEMINGVNFKVPDGTHFVNQPDGTVALMGDKNQEIVGGLRFDAKGGLTDDSRQLLESRGGIFSGTNREIERQVERMTQRTVGVDEFVTKKPDLFHHITRLGWYDNDTEGVFDKNELRLLWGGVSGNGVDANGNYVLDVSQMMSDGSYHGGLSADAMELARQGKLFLSLSVSEGTQTQIVKVAIDATGKAVTDHNSELGRMLFETTGDGQARFLGKFAEVCQSVGTADDGAEQVRVLATAVGRGIEGNLTMTDKVMETVKDSVTDWAVSMPAPEQVFDTLVDVPPIIPITWRTPLEKLRKPDRFEPVIEPTPQRVEPEPVEVVPPIIDKQTPEKQTGPLTMPEINGAPKENEEILMPRPNDDTEENTDKSTGETINPWAPEIPGEDIEQEGNEKYVVLNEKLGGSKERYKIIKIVTGAQSAIAKVEKEMADGTFAQNTYALRYGNGSGEVDKTYNQIYIHAPPEIQRCMPRSYGVEKGRSESLYVVQEWVEGEDLRNELNEKKVLPLEDTTIIFEEIGKLLVYLHAKTGYIHRDIKPENIVIQRNSDGKIDRVVLMDWDLLNEVRGTPEPEGTPGYAAPEAYIVNRELWPVVDDHALGIMMLEMMTGRPVARETTGKLVPDIRDYLNESNLPPRWKEIIEGLTEWDRGKRWTVRRALELLEKDKGTEEFAIAA